MFNKVMALFYLLMTSPFDMCPFQNIQVEFVIELCMRKDSYCMRVQCFDWVRKCACIGLKHGKVYSIQDIFLCNGESICSLALVFVYKYLGLLEADVFSNLK